MAFINKTNSTKANSDERYTQLSVDEYEFLFKLIKSSTFKGDDIDILYKLILKLQSNYVSLKNNKL
jgi:hypothetical protein